MKSIKIPQKKQLQHLKNKTCPYRGETCFLKKCGECGNNFDWDKAHKNAKDYLKKNKMEANKNGRKHTKACK